jgi:2-deoxy-D-gluconate 3-dehydrogenase
VSVSPFDLAGSAAVVTGGAMGIGFGIATALRAAGANVLIADVDRAAGAAAAKSLGSAAFVEVDIRDNDAGGMVVDACRDRFGTIDVLVNNAGVYPVADADVLTADVFDAVFDLNVRGALFLTQAVARAMRDQGDGGSILNIGSMDAFRPSMPGLAAYGASKGAVIAMTKHLAVAFAAHGIRVNAVVPGGIVTEGSARMSEGGAMTDAERDAMIAGFAARVPLGRLGDPADLGGPVVFLASRAAAYVTGAVVLVDGGLILAS